MSAPHFTIVTLENSRSLRMVWFFEELGLSYELKEYKRTPELWGPKELKQEHPLGKVPIVTWTDNQEKKVLAESGAIVEYIVDKYGNGKLSGSKLKPDAQRELLHLLHYSEGSFMVPCFMHLVFAQVSKQGPFLARPLLRLIMGMVQQQTTLQWIPPHVQYLEGILSDKRSYFVGEVLTGADIMLSYPIEAIKPLGLLDNAPHILAWLERIEVRPAYKRAVEKLGVVDHSTWM